MTDSIAVHPDGLAAMVGQLTDLADRLVADGAALHALDRPLLGGSGPANELVDTLTANVLSMAASVAACGGALSRSCSGRPVGRGGLPDDRTAGGGAVVGDGAGVCRHRRQPVDSSARAGSRPSG